MTACEHIQKIPVPETKERTPGCEECLRIGQRWVHLRDLASMTSALKSRRIVQKYGKPPGGRLPGLMSGLGRQSANPMRLSTVCLSSSIDCSLAY